MQHASMCSCTAAEQGLITHSGRPRLRGPAGSGSGSGSDGGASSGTDGVPPRGDGGGGGNGCSGGDSAAAGLQREDWMTMPMERSAPRRDAPDKEAAPEQVGAAWRAAPHGASWAGRAGGRRMAGSAAWSESRAGRA